MTRWRIVADVGGTNKRFAASDAPGRVTRVRRVPTYSGASFVDALIGWLVEIGKDTSLASCDGVGIAAAGPVEKGSVELTNGGLAIDASEVSSRLGGVRCDLVNDLTAVAMLLPHVAACELTAIGDVRLHTSHAARLAINIGTGFGAASSMPIGDGRWLASSSEAGHMTMTASLADEMPLLWNFTSIEDVLSGRGLVRLFERLAEDRVGSSAQARNIPALDDIFALVGRDPFADKLEDTTTRLLGRIAGDLVLATGAWGGAFFCGSVATGWAAVANRAKFRDAFEAKGAMSPRMRTVPTCAIQLDVPALHGLTYGCQ